MIDWITLIHKERMNNKPHTEETKAKMRETHKEVSRRPEIIAARSEGGKISWFNNRESHAKAIGEAMKKGRQKVSAEQQKRNEINRARVAAFLQRTMK